MKTFEGKLQAKGFKIGIVSSRFNQFLTGELLGGALDALKKLGADDADIVIYKVPGSFEIPVVAKKLAASGKVDGVLGAEVTKGLAQIALDQGVPVSFGILTVDTIEQGIERSGTKAGNKGWDAAFSLIETLNLLKDAKL